MLSIRRLCLLALFLVTLSLSSFSQKTDSCGLRIAVLTCGTGDELYSSFGHSGVRVTDSLSGTDIVFNYGTFEFSDDFYKQFMMGKLDYCLSYATFDEFVQEYVHQQRFVHEQVLDLPCTDKANFRAFLENNYLPQNRYYRYEFLDDNCATRIRDIFPKLLGNRFVFGHNIIAPDSTCRQLFDAYLYRGGQDWAAVGISLLLGRRVDRIAGDHGSQYLPDFVFKALAEAKVDGHPLVKETNIILDHPNAGERSGVPLYTFIGLLVLSILLAVLGNKARLAQNIFDTTLFFITGLIGCFMLFMWLGTEHQMCGNNLNILWASPLWIVFCWNIRKPGTITRVFLVLSAVLLLYCLILFPQGTVTELKFWMAVLLVRVAYRLWKGKRP
jgi:hypothetical protein